MKLWSDLEEMKKKWKNTKKNKDRKEIWSVKKRKKKNVLILSSLHSLASLVVSQTYRACSFLPQILDVLDMQKQRSLSLFQIYFLFPLFFFFLIYKIEILL